MGYAGPLTNTVLVMTPEGAAGIYTATSLALVTPALQLSQETAPQPVPAGTPLTYTLRVTNTGNLDLHAAITDSLPAHVTPGGVLTWTSTITAPGGVWSQTIVVTGEAGYSGTLTNTARVTTAEGAAGMDSATVNIYDYRVYLPMVLRQ
jgi:uncharacterized repeat protein (TIGR01451 family)